MSSKVGIAAIGTGGAQACFVPLIANWRALQRTAAAGSSGRLNGAQRMTVESPYYSFVDGAASVAKGGKWTSAAIAKR